MSVTYTNDSWATMTPEDKKRLLFLRQKELLDTFLEKKAITREQYEKSLHDLTEKMGYTENTGSI